MAAKKNVWDVVASAVAERFRVLGGSRSSTLIAVIKSGASRVKVETDAILFDARALTFGLFGAASPSSGGITRPNAAFWFKEWLREREKSVDYVLTGSTPTGAVEKALAGNKSVALSISVQDLCQRAVKFADATVGRTEFDVRHLVGAMIDKGTIAEQVELLFDLSLTVDDVRDLKQFIVAKIMEAPEEGETRESWEAALGLVGNGAPVPPPPAPPDATGQEIIRFSHDSAGGDDVLETKRDVDALAKLLCLKESTPLAVAVFGGWGSGKTTFMQGLDKEVDAIADNAARWEEKGAASPFVTRVVQIKFNAWQFVDANLWASLTAEFFDQLRAGGWRRAGTARHAGLVERVNSHVHSLTAEAAARRAAIAESSRQVLAAQEARDIAAKAVRDAPLKAMGETALNSLGEIYEAQKANLRALGLSSGGRDPTPGIDAVIEAVRSSRSIFRQARALFGMVLKYRAAATFVAFLLLAAAVAGWLLWPGRLQGIDYVSALVALGGLAALWRAVAPAVRLVASVGRRGADLARAVEAADEGAVRELMGKEVALRAATAEAEALAGSADRADRALARYVDPTGPSNPPRLLRYVLEDDPETRAFEKEIGLIGRARRLFQTVNDIILKGDDEVPQRIVLYIDDLDRCTEEQVYNVLQAIHLLLAFESFAVVVGVDVKWIEGALAAEFAQERLPPLSEIDRRQHAVHYLEKIFQVAFWLYPLNTTGKDGGSFAAFVRALTRTEPESKPKPESDSEPDPETELATGKEAGPQSAAGAAAPPRETVSAAGPRDDADADAPTSADDSASTDPIWAFPKAWVDHFRMVVTRFVDGGYWWVEKPAQAAEGEHEREPPVSPEPEPELEPKPEPEPPDPPRAFHTVELNELEIEFLASKTIANLAASTPRSVKRLVNAYRLVRSRLSDDGVLLLGSATAPPAYPFAALAAAIETGQTVKVASAFLDTLKELNKRDEEMLITVVPTTGRPGSKVAPVLSSEFESMLASKLAPSGPATIVRDDNQTIRDECAELLDGLLATHQLRNAGATVAEMLSIVRVARRFSFNRYT
jgi:hypothetical protein